MSEETPGRRTYLVQRGPGELLRYQPQSGVFSYDNGIDRANWYFDHADAAAMAARFGGRVVELTDDGEIVADRHA